MKTRRISTAIPALLVSLVIAPAVLAGGVEWIDMGPLKGLTQGRAWSKVVDEAGNVAGRNETWHVDLPAPAFVELVVKCADPEALGVTIRWKTAHGESLESAVEHQEGLFYRKVSTLWSPATVKDVTVVVATRGTPTDQVYQILCNLYDAAGKPLRSDAAAAASPTTHPSISGSWRYVAGRAKGSVLTIQQRPDGTVASIVCRSTFTNGDHGVNEATRIRWENATTLSYSYSWTEKSTPDLRDGEASIVFDSGTSASIDAKEPGRNAARDALRKD